MYFTQVFVNNKPFNIISPTNISSFEVITNVLKTVEFLQLCEGTGIDTWYR